MIKQIINDLQKAGFNLHSHNALFYFSSDKNPRVCIGSGLHGNEYKIIPLLIKTAIKLKDKLPPFLFIPILSPSSVELKTRVNIDGVDINRDFNNGERSHNETKNIKTVLQNYPPFETLMTVHLDSYKNVAYLYDGTATPLDKKVKSWQKNLAKLGVKFLEGPDDLEDPALGVNFAKGYYSFDPKSDTFIETFETWSSLHSEAKRNLTLEVPALVPDKLKEIILEESLLHLL